MIIYRQKLRLFLVYAIYRNGANFEFTGFPVGKNGKITIRGKNLTILLISNYHVGKEIENK
jgi:hypothetical protein